MALIITDGSTQHLRATVDIPNLPFTLAGILRKGSLTGSENAFISAGQVAPVTPLEFSAIRDTDANQARATMFSGGSEYNSQLAPGLDDETYTPCVATFNTDEIVLYMPGREATHLSVSLAPVVYDYLTVGHAANQYNGGACVNCGIEHAVWWSTVLDSAEIAAYLGQTLNPTEIASANILSYLPLVDDLEADAGTVSWTATGLETPTFEASGYTFPAPAGTPISFVSEGAIFAPLIEVTGTPVILWTFADATTSDSVSPVKDYGTVGQRTATLTVTPWSALVGINLGYTAEDNGSEDITLHDPQNVSGITGLEAVQTTLQYICASYNPITAVDFTGFTALHTVEFYDADLTTFVSAGCTELRRCCLELCSVLVNDLSDCAALEDLRYASNGTGTVLTLPPVAPNLWHICVRSNHGQVISRNLIYPALRDLWIWDCGHSGEMVIESDNLISVLSAGNSFSNFVINGSTLIGNCSINLNGNALPSANVQAILDFVAESDVSNGTIDLSGGTNGAPIDLTAVTTLEGMGYTVTLNEPAPIIYRLTYNANGATAGTVPIDSTEYEPDSLATVAGNTGLLERTGFTFDGWAYDSDGLMPTGETVPMTQDWELFAIWIAIPSVLTSTPGNFTALIIPFNFTAEVI